MDRDKKKTKPHVTKEVHQCEATSKQTGERCKQFVKTPCKNGRYLCRFHGGASRGGGIPKEKAKGNKNAVVTGEFESIYKDDFSEKENEFYTEVLLKRYNDEMFRLEEDLRLTVIREKRMLQKLKNLHEDYDALRMKIILSEEKFEAGELKLDTINRIEDSLTRVQAQKSKIEDQILKLKQWEEDRKNGFYNSQVEFRVTRNPVKPILDDEE